jgi:hypothetical protein
MSLVPKHRLRHHSNPPSPQNLSLLLTFPPIQLTQTHSLNSQQSPKTVSQSLHFPFPRHQSPSRSNHNPHRSPQHPSQIHPKRNQLIKMGQKRSHFWTSLVIYNINYPNRS